MKTLQRVQFMDNLDEARKHLDYVWCTYERRRRRFKNPSIRKLNGQFAEAVARYRSLRTQCFPGHKGRLTVVRAH
jgi:hypothetical protein